MRNRFLIADHTVQAEDEALSALLTGFECDSERTSASDPCGQEPICSVGIADIPPIHGVEQLDSDFPIRHVLTLTRYSDAVLVADDRFERATLRALQPCGLEDLLLLAVYSRLTYYRTLLRGLRGALRNLSTDLPVLCSRSPDLPPSTATIPLERRSICAG